MGPWATANYCRAGIKSLRGTRMFLCLPDPHPDPSLFVRIGIRIRILPSTSKKSKKNLNLYYFVTFFDYLSLKTDVNVPSKSKMQKHFEKKKFFFDILSATDEKSRIWIRKSVVRIRGSRNGFRSGSGPVPKCHIHNTASQHSAYVPHM